MANIYLSKYAKKGQTATIHQTSSNDHKLIDLKSIKALTDIASKKGERSVRAVCQRERLVAKPAQ
ncbi:HXXXD-type acyl-transferase-like protein [Corchorus olitorius]|uniref:HXXXD-type acyl-transferase-like protein n=1 Tax=Corchorus olitorius TaxID=93759 RepID=A0A1R3H2I0_9ROSI|nr:HXXXD-type acyl-transferase-like protein [Corchorus olitorius]